MGYLVEDPLEDNAEADDKEEDHLQQKFFLVLLEKFAPASDLVVYGFEVLPLGLLYHKAIL